MKLIGILGALLLASAIGTPAAHDLVLDVPFRFAAGTAEFEPGRYAVTLDAGWPGSLTIRPEGGTEGVVVLARTVAVSSETASGARFAALGGMRFLSEIRTGNSTAWRPLPAARQLQLEMETVGTVATTVLARR